jgi:hypothetical protein
MNIKQRWLRHIANQRILNQEVVSSNPIEQKGVNIFLSLLKDPNSMLTVAPISGEKLIDNREKEILAILSYNNLTIINSVYQYEINMKERLVEKLKIQFNETQEKRANIIKRKANKKVKQSLDTLLEMLNKINLD